MGASPKHKLSPEAIRALEWINQGPDPALPAAASIRALHGNLKRDLSLLAHLYQGGADSRRYLGRVRRAHRGLRRATPEEILRRMLTDLVEKISPIPFTVWFDPGPPRQAHLALDARHTERPIAVSYFFMKLLQDMWEKGPDRLKPCAWPRCFRFLWDRTTAKRKRYCEGLHDRERLIEREKRSRQKRTSRRK